MLFEVGELDKGEGVEREVRDMKGWERRWRKGEVRGRKGRTATETSSAPRLRSGRDCDVKLQALCGRAGLGN